MNRGLPVHTTKDARWNVSPSIADLRDMLQNTIDMLAFIEEAWPTVTDSDRPHYEAAAEHCRNRIETLQTAINR